MLNRIKVFEVGNCASIETIVNNWCEKYHCIPLSVSVVVSRKDNYLITLVYSK